MGSSGALPSTVNVLGTLRSDVQAINTVAETTLCTLTVPGGVLATGDTLRFVIGGDVWNASGATVNFTFMFKFGATTVLSGVVAVGTTAGGANIRKWELEVDMVILSTTAQRVVANFVLGTATSSSLPIAASAVSAGAGRGVATENTATAKDCVATVTMDTASASAYCTAAMALLTHLEAA